MAESAGLGCEVSAVEAGERPALVSPAPRRPGAPLGFDTADALPVDLPLDVLLSPGVGGFFAPPAFDAVLDCGRTLESPALPFPPLAVDFPDGDEGSAELS